MGKVLSIFVDESGRFQFPDANSRFYILGLVLHDQSQPVDSYVADLQRAEDEIGLEGHCFHAGPLIRKEKGYEFMSRKWRGRILSRMMAFAQKVPFKYHCPRTDFVRPSTSRLLVVRATPRGAGGSHGFPRSLAFP